MNEKLRITSSQYTDDGGHEKLHLDIRFTQSTVPSRELVSRLNTLSSLVGTVATAYRARGNLITCVALTAHLSVVGVNVEQSEIDSFMNSLREALEPYEIEFVKV